MTTTRSYARTLLPGRWDATRVAEKVGFRREGVLRSHLVHPDGRRRDSVLFSLLPGELG